MTLKSGVVRSRPSLHLEPAPPAPFQFIKQAIRIKRGFRGGAGKQVVEGGVGIRGSLRRGIIGLICSDHARLARNSRCPPLHYLIATKPVTVTPGSVAGRQHDPEARLAAHHAIVGLGRAFQRVDLDHRSHTRERAERKRLLRVD